MRREISCCWDIAPAQKAIPEVLFTAVLAAEFCPKMEKCVLESSYSWDAVPARCILSNWSGQMEEEVHLERDGKIKRCVKWDDKKV